MNTDDEKGGHYYGPYAWPGGVPIATPEEVAEIREKLLVSEEVKEEFMHLLEENIKAEFPGISEKKAKELAGNVWLKMS